jgi:hypothetical protein
MFYELQDNPKLCLGTVPPPFLNALIIASELAIELDSVSTQSADSWPPASTPPLPFKISDSQREWRAAQTRGLLRLCCQELMPDPLFNYLA